ncbi:GAF domain-containing protein [Enterococcus timonensis]|uniref:GAF domain-containing protein n=1 Tax=Enterococcus timonensis TaxID=1852364 RepID=UPI0008DACAD4|nr:GAF domain-containing protein [Enterococcus timonensis]
MTKEKIDRYKLLLAQTEGLLEMEQEKIASLANISAALNETLDHSVYTGFYLYDSSELVLGPFQGRVSCTRIQLGKGVCGQSAAENTTLIVDDVTKHENYISCDSAAMSEIVVPLYKNQQLLGVIDLDNDQVGAYDQIDQEYLEKLAALMVEKIHW